MSDYTIRSFVNFDYNPLGVLVPSSNLVRRSEDYIDDLYGREGLYPKEIKLQVEIEMMEHVRASLVMNRKSPFALLKDKYILHHHGKGSDLPPGVKELYFSRVRLGKETFFISCKGAYHPYSEIHLTGESEHICLLRFHMTDNFKYVMTVVEVCKD